MFYHLRNKDLSMAVGFYYAVAILLFWFAHPAAAATGTPRGFESAHALSPYAALSLCINNGTVEADHESEHCDFCRLTTGRTVPTLPEDIGHLYAFHRLFQTVPQSVSKEKLVQRCGFGPRSPPLSNS
ncbi:MAG: hypothetical protein ABJN26_06645 [Stappiaceae bacterium]